MPATYLAKIVEGDRMSLTIILADGSPAQFELHKWDVQTFITAHSSIKISLRNWLFIFKRVKIDFVIICQNF